MLFFLFSLLPVQTSESKFRNFKSKKRPWSMQTLPVTPSPSGTPISSEKPLGGQNQVFPEELEEEEEEEAAAEDTHSTSQPEEADVATFRYKSRANVLSRSFRGHDSAAARFAARRQRTEDLNLVVVGASTECAGGKSAEGGDEGSEGLVNQTLGSRESSTCTSTDGSRTELNIGTGEGGGRDEELAKPLAVKSHPYTRRIDITPNSPSNVQRTRPKILAYGKSDVENRKSKTGPAMLARRSTLASIPTGRRLLPAPPVRRGSRQMLGHITSPSSDEKSESSNVPTPVSAQSISSFATKLASSLEDVAAKEKSAQNDTTDSNSVSDLPVKRNPRAAARSESLSSLHSRDEEHPPSPRVKHTVQYKHSGKLECCGRERVVVSSCRHYTCKIFSVSVVGYSDIIDMPTSSETCHRLTGPPRAMSQ